MLINTVVMGMGMGMNEFVSERFPLFMHPFLVKELPASVVTYNLPARAPVKGDNKYRAKLYLLTPPPPKYHIFFVKICGLVVKLR